MIAVLVRRVGPLLVLAACLWFCIDRQQLAVTHADGWFHLRIGNELLSTWSIRDPGHLGAFDSAEWLPTQWASQMAMAAVYGVGGLDGVLWLLGSVQLVLIGVVFLGCRVTSGPVPAAAATLLTTLAASYGLSPRPQVVSYLFIAITVFAWLASSRDGRARWWLVALAWVWAPLHGMWPVAAIIGATALAGIAMDRRWPRADVYRMSAVVALSLVGPLLSPLGLGVYRGVLDVAGRREYFDEWGPTDFTQPFAVVLVIMLAMGALSVGSRRPSWAYPLLLGLAALWAVYSMRTAAVAAVMAAPFVAESLQRWLPRASPAGRGERGMVAGLIVVWMAVWGGAAASRPSEDVVPTWVDARLGSLPADAGVLNDWRDGPYLLWRHPDLSIVMHGYGEAFTRDELDRNVAILHLEPGWDREVAALDLDAALVQTDSPLGYALAHHAGWTVVQQDAEYMYLVPAAM